LFALLPGAMMTYVRRIWFATGTRATAEAGTALGAAVLGVA